MTSKEAYKYIHAAFCAMNAEAYPFGTLVELCKKCNNGTNDIVYDLPCTFELAHKWCCDICILYNDIGRDEQCLFIIRGRRHTSIRISKILNLIHDGEYGKARSMLAKADKQLKSISEADLIGGHNKLAENLTLFTCVVLSKHRTLGRVLWDQRLDL